MGIASRVKNAIGHTSQKLNRFMIRNESKPLLLSDASSMPSASSHLPILRRYQTVSGHGIDSAANPGKKHQITAVAYCVRIAGPSSDAHR
jgi:hypothetical protein